MGMKTSLPVGIFIGLILTALVGCAAGSPPGSPTASHAASPNTVPSASAKSVPAEPGLPADVCTKMPLARVNQLTGLDLTSAQVVPPQGFNAAECVYMNATDPVDASDQVNALVVTGDDAGRLWDQTKDVSQDGYADLPGVGKRAYTADGVVAVDYGGLLIIVDDWASTGDTLYIDQLRFLVDELHNLYS